jgi:hypothetical protein
MRTRHVLHGRDLTQDNRLARNPALLRRVWDHLRGVMAAGALDTMTKELI